MTMRNQTERLKKIRIQQNGLKKVLEELRQKVLVEVAKIVKVKNTKDVQNFPN